MSKMGSAGQDVLTREYNLPTSAGDNKLYTHTHKTTARLHYQKLKARKKFLLYRIRILEPSGAGIKVH